jgi:phytoene synthase
VTYHHAKTFYFASLFLAKEKRKACYAVYAFCRYVDDLVDNAPKESLLEDTILLVEKWRKAIKDVYEGRMQDSSDTGTQLVMMAWADTLTHYKIPAKLPEELIEGVLMDTYLDRFETFDELYTYCYKVASVVGLMTSEIFHYSHSDALKHAIDLGIAMQLTNICRDIAEDADRARVYIPQEELQRFNVSESDILQKKFTPEFQQLMKFQVDRANALYDSADIGIAYLDDDSRLTVQLMSTNYRRILNKLVSMQYNPFIERAHLTFSEKLLAVPRAYLQTLSMR